MTREVHACMQPKSWMSYNHFFKFSNYISNKTFSLIEKGAREREKKIKKNEEEEKEETLY